MIDDMLKATRADKVRDGGRTLILIGVVWCATQINEVKQRVGIIEYRLTNRTESTNKLHGIAQVSTHQKPARRDGYKPNATVVGREGHSGAR